MLWDGKSKGTVNNVVNLSRDRKPMVVYVARTKQFRTIKTYEDLRDLLAQGDSDSVDRIVRELHLNVVLQSSRLEPLTARPGPDRVCSSSDHTTAEARPWYRMNFRLRSLTARAAALVRTFGQLRRTSAGRALREGAAVILSGPCRKMRG